MADDEHEGNKFRRAGILTVRGLPIGHGDEEGDHHVRPADEGAKTPLAAVDAA